MLRSFAAALALAFAPVAAFAADDENPYKNAKVGDYSEYNLSAKISTFNVNGKLKQTVTDKNEKEAVVEVTGTIDFNNMMSEIPVSVLKIDLTKPLDPTKGANISAGSDAKVEKGKEGKEKITVNGKEYDATWTTYRVKGKTKWLNMDVDVDADVKAWIVKEVPTGLVKMTMNATLDKNVLEMTMELKETGNKKK